MRRREFLGALGGVAATQPVAARAQQQLSKGDLGRGIGQRAMYPLDTEPRDAEPKNAAPTATEAFEPAISVVIPVLNRPDFLIRAVASVRAQTLHPIEILVVDDGSDPPIEIRLDGVTVLRSDINKGAAAARNIGVAAARGDYIAFLDSDDVWHPEKLAAQIAFMRAMGSVVCTTGFWLRHVNNVLQPELRLPKGPISVSDLIWGIHLSPGSTLVVRAEAMRAIGLQDEGLRRLEDWDWLLRAAYLYRIDVLDRPLATLDDSLPAPSFLVRNCAMKVMRRHVWRLSKLSPLNVARILSTVLFECAASHYRQRRALAAIIFGVGSVVVWPLYNRHIFRRMLVRRISVDATPTRLPLVMHVISGLGYGGAERALTNLVLMEHGKGQHPRQQLVVSLSGDGIYGPVIRRAGIEVVGFDAKNFVGLIRSIIYIARLMRTKLPGIVNCWMYHANLVGLVAVMLSGRRRSLHLYWGIRCSDMDISQYSWSMTWARRFGAWLSSLPDLIVLNSFRGARIHADFGYKTSQFVVFDNGVDPYRFRPNDGHRRRRRQEIGIPDDEFVIGIVARVDPMKGYPILCAALCRCPGVRCVAIGSGTENLPQSEQFMGIGPIDKVEEFLPALDALVSPSEFGEGWSNAIAEAMAAGLPIIATDVGDAARIVADTGIIVTSGDIDALADAIRALQRDPQRRLALGIAARRRIIEHFSLDICSARFNRLFDDSVGDTNVG